MNLQVRGFDHRVLGQILFLTIRNPGSGAHAAYYNEEPPKSVLVVASVPMVQR